MNTNDWENYRSRGQRLPPGQRIISVPSSTIPQQGSMPPRQGKPGPVAKKSAPRMPKARALALVGIFKRWIVMTSLVGFLSLSGLAALHRTGTTSTTSTHIASATSASKKTVTATATAKAKTSATATAKKKTTVKATPTQKAYSFGSSTPTPVTTSGVS
jgi:cytoskeletal protein RodZ